MKSVYKIGYERIYFPVTWVGLKVAYSKDNDFIIHKNAFWHAYSINVDPAEQSFDPLFQQSPAKQYRITIECSKRSKVPLICTCMYSWPWHTTFFPDTSCHIFFYLLTLLKKIGNSYPTCVAKRWTALPYHNDVTTGQSANTTYLGVARCESALKSSQRNCTS